MKLRMTKYKWIILLTLIAVFAIGGAVFSATGVGEIFHDQGYVYISDIEPEKGEAITVKLRAEKGNLKSATLHYTTDSFSSDSPYDNWTTTTMTKKGEDSTKYYEYWEATIPGHDNPYYYCFQATAQNSTSTYYSARGKVDSRWYESSFSIIPGFSTPQWAKGAYWYFMNPDGFYNGDIHNDAVDTETQKGVAWNSNLSGLMERYGGDLQGVTEKVDYLKNLGIEAVYLNPIWDTRQNMGYGPLSYYKISPNLGTDADLIALSQKLHENNMKLSLDAIFSYAMDDGVWANSSLNPLPAEDIFVKDADGNIQKVWGNPQIDLSKERAKELLYQGTDSVMKRYLKEPYSIDSWRFDAVNSYSPAAGTAAYKTIVKEIQDAALAENPNVLLIAEEFSRVTADKKILSEEYWDTTYGQRGYFRRWFSGEYDQDDFASNLMDYVVRTRSMGLCTVNLYDLHDEARITNDTVADAAKIRALNLCQMIFVGAPCTYYGDEVGTTNNEDEGFGVQKINSFNWNEEEWDRSIYNLQCAMGQLRKEYTALKTGVNLFEVLDNNKKLMAFGRFDENGTVIAVTNQSDQTYTQTVSVKKYNVPDGKVLTDYITGKQYTVSGGSIQMEVLPGGNVLVTGAKSAKYGTEDVYTVKKILAETTLYKEFKPGDTVSFLQTPSQSDYTIKCEMGAVTGNESMPVGVVDQKDEKHMIFAGRIRLSGQSYLALGEILNGEVIIRAKVVDTASDGVCTVQLQKIGTDFSAVYSYNGETWYTIGKNVRANYSAHKAGLYVPSDATVDIKYVCFGDSIVDGTTICTPCYPEDLSCEFVSNYENQVRSKVSIVGNQSEWAYVGGGIARTSGTGISQLAIQNRQFTDFRILVTLLPDSGCTAGITMLRSSIDSTTGQGYLLSLSSEGKLALSYNGTELKSSTVAIPSTGLTVAVERVGNDLWVYSGEARDYVFSIDNVTVAKGYVSYFLNGTGKILSDSIHTLTQSWTDILGTYQASFVLENGAIVSDTKEYEGEYYRMSTFNHISAIGFTDVLFGGTVTVSQVNVDDASCYAGFVIGAKQRAVVEQSDGYYLTLHKDGYVRLSKNGEELAKSSKTYGSSARLLMMQKENQLSIYVNGDYCKELSIESEAVEGGVVGIATYNSRSAFEDMQLADITNGETPIEPGKYDTVVSDKLSIQSGNYDANNNVYRATGVSAYADFATNLTGNDRCISFDVKTDASNFEIRYRTATNTVLALRIYATQCVAVVGGSDVSNWPQFQNTSLGTLDLSEYHHVVLHSDTNSVKLWIDGVAMPAITYDSDFSNTLYTQPYCGVYLPLEETQSAEIRNMAVWEETSNISGCPVPSRKDKIGTLTCITEPTYNDGVVSLSYLAPEVRFNTGITSGNYAMSFDVDTAGDAVDIYCHTNGTAPSFLRLENKKVVGYVGSEMKATQSVNWLTVSEISNITLSVADEKLQLWINGIPVILPDGFLGDGALSECLQGLRLSLANGQIATVSNIKIWERNSDELYYNTKEHVLYSDGVYTGGTVIDTQNNAVELGGEQLVDAFFTTGLEQASDYYYSFTVSDVTADCINVAYLSNGSKYLVLRIYSTQYLVVDDSGACSEWLQLKNTEVGSLNLTAENRVTMHVMKDNLEVWINGQKLPTIAYTSDVSAYTVNYPGVYVYPGHSANVSDIAVWREIVSEKPVYVSGKNKLLKKQDSIALGNTSASAKTIAMDGMPISGNEFCMSFEVETDASYYQVSLRGTSDKSIALRIYKSQCVLLDAQDNNIQISNWPQLGNTKLGYLSEKWSTQKMYCTLRVKNNLAELWINGQKVNGFTMSITDWSDYLNTYVAVSSYGGTHTNFSNMKLWTGR